MTSGSLRGLTWDHPRAYSALDALAHLDTAGEGTFGQVPVPMTWDKQPLSGFESTPIAEVASRYDVVVLDHPGLADAVAVDALTPLDELFDDAWLTHLSGATVGRAYESYRYGGRQWALPLDVATQVSAARTDLLADTEPPTTWSDVLRLSNTMAISLCLGGPHALLMVLALCIAQGDKPCQTARLASPEALATALDMIARLLARADRDISLLDPIGVLDALACGAVAYCPLVYGYVTYSTVAKPPVGFCDAPTWATADRPGSVLGGTGLAVARGTRDHAAASAHLGRLVSETVQVEFIPRHGGQPSARAAWLSPAVNAPSHDFYRNTIRTVEHAWVRPRRRGFVSFCDQASAVVRDGLLNGEPVQHIAGRIDTTYHEYCENEVDR